MSKLYIGIDPGKSGAIATIRKGKILDIVDMPLIVTGYTSAKNPTPKTELDPIGLLQHLKQYQGKDAIVTLEHVWAMGHDSAMTAGALMGSFWMIQTALYALGIPFQLFAPMTWKKGVFTKKSDMSVKEASIQYCQRLFPSTCELIRPVNKRGNGLNQPNHNRADAVLIAEYGRRYTEGEIAPATRTRKTKVEAVA